MDMEVKTYIVTHNTNVTLHTHFSVLFIAIWLITFNWLHYATVKNAAKKTGFICFFVLTVCSTLVCDLLSSVRCCTWSTYMYVYIYDDMKLCLLHATALSHKLIFTLLTLHGLFSFTVQKSIKLLCLRLQ